MDDLASITRIYNQAVRQGFCTAHLEEVSLKKQELWLQEHEADRFPVLILEAKEVVIGWLSLSPYRKGRQAFAAVAEVSYYLDQEWQGQGQGSYLLNYAIRKAPDWGFQVLIAILLDRNPASLALLQKFGFREWGRMPELAVIGDQKADHLYYGLKL